MYKILLVEDDRQICECVSRHLTNWGYDVTCIVDFTRVFETFVSVAPQLVLLDVGLPYKNGFHWCERIRAFSKTPIIFLSSEGEGMSVIMGIKLGGDDYITKPFDIDVLTAKVQAVLRRSYDLAENKNKLCVGAVTLDIDEASLTYNGEKLPLTKNDFRIMQVLMENAGKIISREKLMLRLWESERFIDENTLSVSVARLRKKLDAIGLPDFIDTKKGLGYIIIER